MRSDNNNKFLDFSSKHGKRQLIEEKGLFCAIMCPHCSRRIVVMYDVYLSPTIRRHRKGGIQDFFSSEEWKRYKKLITLDKIVFGLGKFREVYQQYPNQSQAAVFIGLTRQTISKYIHLTHLVSVTKQGRASTGHFTPKILSLTNEGLRRYAELTYQVFGFPKNHNT